MSVSRHFLGWDGPCLPRVRDVLLERHASAAGWDMSGVLLVVPGARAGRRLLELLADAGAGRALTPPTITTVGRLPEYLYTTEAKVADDLRSLLARVASLRSADPDLLALVAPHRPGPDDWPDWLALARDLQALYESLAAGNVAVRDVAGRCAEVGHFLEEPRWESLSALQAEYESTLVSAGWVDRHQARSAAIDDKSCSCDFQIGLVGVSELTGVACTMMEQVADRVTAFIHAHESEAGAFDAFGCIDAAHWSQRSLDIDPSTVHVVDRPRDQAMEVVRLLGDAGDDSLGGRYSADQVTVGLGDESAGPMVVRSLSLAGANARPAVGRPVGRTPPATLLRALGALMSRGSFTELAAVLRHSDVDAYLRQQTDHSDHDLPRGVATWIGLLDQYMSEHVQGRLTGDWLGDADTAAALKAVYQSVIDLLPADASAARPLPQWSQPLADSLLRVYGDEAFDQHDPNQRPMVEALQSLGGVLRDLARLNAEDPTTPSVTGGQAVAFLLDLIREVTLPPQPTGQGGLPVELVGWLELQLDDAPALIVTGVNEGHVPQSVHADPFLPDRARGLLGLTDNRRRYARDLYALTAILQSRTDVRLITGRRDADNNPLTPSRLLLACEGEVLAERVARFCADDVEASPPAVILNAGGVSRFLVPPPKPPAEPIKKMRVTAFRDYLACPYRFYLKHVCHLDDADDRVVELTGASFGTLAHEVLAAFGRSDLRDTSDAGAIHGFLRETLAARVRRSHGDLPPPAVAIQVARLEERFEAFAHWQAKQADAGWRILEPHVECRVSAPLPMGDEPAFKISGQIDRIDEHPTEGYRLLDYKTADTARPAEKSHRIGPRDVKEWVDLQLPLYRVLARAEGVDVDGRSVQLGYVQLPKDLSQVGLEVADWETDDLEDAEQTARWVVQQVRGGVFWPPAPDPPKWDDGLGLICMDECFDRRAGIERGERLMRSGGSP